MEEKIKAVVLKLIPCCLTLKPLVTSRLLTNLMLSKTCSYWAQDECTVSASVGDHTRELLWQYGPVPPRRTLNIGQSRDATESMGSGWPGGGCTSARHNLCWGPFPSNKERQYLLELLFDCESSQAGLSTSHPAPRDTAVSSPILLCSHTLPCQNNCEGLCCPIHALNTPSLLLENTAPGNPHQSRGRERAFSTRR